MMRAAAAVLGLALLAIAGSLLLSRHRAPTSPGARSFAPGLPRRESLRYVLYLNGVRAGALHTRLRPVRSGADHQGADHRLEFTWRLEQMPAIRSLWKFRATGRTVLRPVSLRAQTARITTVSGTRRKATRVHFPPGRGVATIEERESDEPEVDRAEVPVDSGLDFPAVLLRLRAHGAEGLPQRCRVLNGDDLYELQRTGHSDTYLELPDGPAATELISLTGRKIDDPEKEGERTDGGLEMRVWLDESTGVLLKIEAHTGLGKLQALLAERKAE